jgi:hypothetical protein
VSENENVGKKYRDTYESYKMRRLIVALFTKYYYSNQIKKDRICGAYIMHRNTYE